MAGAVLRRPELRELDRELHDLCQPVTTLQCRLELGRMVGSEEALREAVEGALEDAARVFEAVTRMRERLVAMDADEVIDGTE